MAEPNTRMICRTCGRTTPVDLAAKLSGTALWPRCCDRGTALVTFPTAAQIEAVGGPLLVSAVRAVLAARERESTVHA